MLNRTPQIRPPALPLRTSVFATALLLAACCCSWPARGSGTFSVNVAITDTCGSNPRTLFAPGETIHAQATHTCTAPGGTLTWEWQVGGGAWTPGTDTFSAPVPTTPGTYAISARATIVWSGGSESQGGSGQFGVLGITIDAPTPAHIPPGIPVGVAQTFVATTVPAGNEAFIEWEIVHPKLAPTTGAGASITWTPAEYSDAVDDVQVRARIDLCMAAPVEALASTTVVAVTAIAPSPSSMSFDYLGTVSSESEFTLTVVPTAAFASYVSVSPLPYTFLVGGVHTFTATCGASSATCEVQICPSCTGSTCVAPAGTPNPVPTPSSVRFGVGVGHAANGTPAGRLRVYSETLDPSLATPASLAFAGPEGGAEVLRDGDTLRQVLSADALADIVATSATGYEIRFYRPADVGAQGQDGFYTLLPAAEAFAVWTVEDVDGTPGELTRLRIERAAGGSAQAWEFSLDGDVLALASGNGLRTESLVPGTANGDRTETRIVAGQAGEVSRTTTVHHEFPWGEERIREIRDPAGDALTTEWGYGTDPGDSYTRLAWTSRPNGAWEKYEYAGDGRLVRVLSAWKDVAMQNATPANCRRRDMDFAPVDPADDGTVRPGSARIVSEYVEGVQVSRTWHAYHVDGNGHEVTVVERAAAQSAQYGDAGNLRTVSVAHPSSAPWPLAGKPISATHADGRVDQWIHVAGVFDFDPLSPGDSTFVPGPGAFLRTTHAQGTLAAPDGRPFRDTLRTTVASPQGATLMTEELVVTNGAPARVAWTVHEFDADGHVIHTWNSDGTETSSVWSTCCGKQSETMAAGTVYLYAYDALERLDLAVKIGHGGRPDLTTVFDLDAEGRQTGTTVVAGGLSRSTQSAFDLAGRLVATADAAGLVTTYDYAAGGRITTVTRPGGASEVRENHLDGRPKSTTGTASTPAYHDYGVNPDGTQWNTVHTGEIPAGGTFADIPMWQTTITDLLGRTVAVEKPTFGGEGVAVSTSHHDELGRLVRTELTAGGTPVQADTLHEYDAFGQFLRSGLDVDGNGLLDLDGDDRIQESETLYEQDGGGDWWRVATSRTYAAAGDPTPTVSGISRQRLTGLGATGSLGILTAESRSLDARGGQTVSRTWIDAAAKTVTRVVDTPASGTDAETVAVNGLLLASTSPTGLTTAYDYDALERQTIATDPRTGDATTHYNALGQVDWVEDAAGNRTSFAYDPATGRRISVADPLGTVTYTAYTQRGEVWRAWGGTYPVEYAYDAHGRMVAMSTFRGGGGWEGPDWPANPGAADTTEWVHDPATGLLAAKTYADATSTFYAYDDAGRLLIRSWARQFGAEPLATEYAYHPATGQLLAIDYADSTPDLAYTYTRQGQRQTVVDASGTQTFAYDAFGALDTVSYTSGPLAGHTLDYDHDTLGRPAGFALDNGTTTLAQASYAYDVNTGRLASVSDGADTFAYGYLAGSNLLETVSFPNGLAATRAYEADRNLLAMVTNQIGQVVVSSHAYQNDDAGRRTRATREDGSFWDYAYDHRSQVTGGVKRLADGTPIPGFAFGYAFDPIGNRTTATENGYQTSHASNALNQYTERGVPSLAHVRGRAGVDAIVTARPTVAGTPVAPPTQSQRLGETFFVPLPVDNAAAPFLGAAEVTAVLPGAAPGGEDIVATESRPVRIPQAQQTLTYDLDGNLTSDGIWTYEWNAENRLVAMTPIPPYSDTPKLEFFYDSQGRRFRKTVYAWQTDHWSLTTDHLFIYDNWNLIAELDANASNAPVRTHLWGTDLSGSMQGAGGVGGLLSSTIHDPQPTTYVPCYDGNGNGNAYVDAATGAKSATFDYDPFGNTVVAEGANLADLPFRFSTKYIDPETGLLYYGLRYYHPEMGRWANRDPIGEDGGENLMVFVANSAICLYDALGERLIYGTGFSSSERSWLEHRLGPSGDLVNIIASSRAELVGKLPGVRSALSTEEVRADRDAVQKVICKLYLQYLEREYVTSISNLDALEAYLLTVRGTAAPKNLTLKRGRGNAYPADTGTRDIKFHNPFFNSSGEGNTSLLFHELFHLLGPSFKHPAKANDKEGWGLDFPIPGSGIHYFWHGGLAVRPVASDPYGMQDALAIGGGVNLRSFKMVIQLMLGNGNMVEGIRSLNTCCGSEIWRY